MSEIKSEDIAFRAIADAPESMLNRVLEAPVQQSLYHLALAAEVDTFVTHMDAAFSSFQRLASYTEVLRAHKKRVSSVG